MKLFENQTFTSFDDRDSAAIFSDIEFRQCCFKDCVVSITSDPSKRSTFRRIAMVDCDVNAGSIGAAIVEESVIDGLKIAGLFQTFGAVFKHVTLRGKIGDLMITNDVLPNMALHKEYWDEEIIAFRQANAEYYRNVDWALDISQAQFKDLDIRGVPARLFRRDPETQIVVTRQKALNGEWRDLPFADSLTPFSLDFMLKQEMPDTILVAPKRHRKFPLYLKDLQLLREAGIAELD